MHREIKENLETTNVSNGDFRRNYGTLIGAFLYLRSLIAARGFPFYWTGLLLVRLLARIHGQFFGRSNRGPLL